MQEISGVVVKRDGSDKYEARIIIGRQSYIVGEAGTEDEAVRNLAREVAALTYFCEPARQNA